MNWDIAYLTIFIIISNSQKFPGTKKISIYQLFRLPEDWKYLYCCEWNTVILTLIQPPLLLIPSLYPQLCWDPIYYVVIWNLTSRKIFLIADMPKTKVWVNHQFIKREYYNLRQQIWRSVMWLKWVFIKYLGGLFWLAKFYIW